MCAKVDTIVLVLVGKCRNGLKAHVCGQIELNRVWYIGATAEGDRQDRIIGNQVLSVDVFRFQIAEFQVIEAADRVQPIELTNRVQQMIANGLLR